VLVVLYVQWGVSKLYININLPHRVMDIFDGGEFFKVEYIYYCKYVVGDQLNVYSQSAEE
jgi:hypothetical protein